MRKTIILCLAAALAFTGCDLSGIEIDTNPHKDLQLTTKGAEYIQKGNDFSLNFLEKIDKDAQGSYVISPLSLQFLLGMILDGAQGQTADEICEVLGYGAGEIDQVNEYCKSMLKQLPALDNKTTIKIANAILVDKSGELLDTYKKSVANYYEAYVESIDFANSQAAVNKINNWCSRNTNGLITKIIDNIPPDTFACLMNALYFKGKWSEPFEKSNTVDETFIKESGDKLKVPMMKQEAKFNYTENDVCQVVRLPYGNGAYSMVVALPLEGHTVAEVIAAMKKTGWESFTAPIDQPSVNLWLPRFEAKFEGELNDMLEQLGMPTAFTAAADFGAMTEHPVCISVIKQKAIIKVNEEGSEAAAVSIGFMKDTAYMPGKTVTFHANRPFLYFITENSSGAILFSGRYSG
jgi:Serine protease inhibitor